MAKNEDVPALNAIFITFAKKRIDWVEIISKQKYVLSSQIFIDPILNLQQVYKDVHQ